MTREPPADPLQGSIRTLQVIAFAGCMGLLCFSGIALMISNKPQAEDDVLWAVPIWIAALMGLIRVALEWGISLRRRSTLGANPDSSPERSEWRSRLRATFTIVILMEYACIWVPAFFFFIAYIIQHQVPELIVGYLLILGLALSGRRLNRKRKVWIDKQIRLIEKQCASGEPY